MIMGAYCVGKVYNMLPWYYDIWSILRRYGTQYSTLVVLRYLEHIEKVGYTICYLDSIMIIIAYCAGKVTHMLPQ